MLGTLPLPWLAFIFRARFHAMARFFLLVLAIRVGSLALHGTRTLK